MMKQAVWCWLSVLVLGMSLLCGCDKSQDRIDFQIVYSHSNESVMHDALQYWNELLEQQSGGRIRLMFTSTEAMDTNFCLDQLMSSTEPLMTTSTFGFLADRYAPELSALCAPYYFRLKLQYEKLIHSNWFQEQRTILRNHNVILLDSWFLGWEVQMLRRDIDNVEDAARINFLIPSTTADVASARSLNYTPIPVSPELFKDVVQNRSLSGISGPIWVLDEHNLFSPEYKILVDNNRMRIENILITRDQFFNLSVEDQELLVNTCRAAGYFASGMATMRGDEIMNSLRQRGIEVSVIDPKFRNELQSLSERYFDDPDLIKHWRPGLLHRLEQLSDIFEYQKAGP